MKQWQSVAAACGITFLGLFAYGSELDDANRLFVLEKYDDAIRMYQNVASAENEKESAEALFGIGRAYQMLGRWRLAREGFQKLLQNHPDSALAPGARIEIGQCDVKLGRPRQALVIFQDVKRRYPGEEAEIEATYNVANLNAGFFGDDVTNARAAVEGYNRVLQSDWGNRYAIQSYFGLGQCYMLLRDYSRAVDAFRAAIEQGPDTIWARYARDQLFNAVRFLSDAAPLKQFAETDRFWSDFERSILSYFPVGQPVAWRSPASQPVLRIRAVRFRTEPQKDASGVQKVLYVKPTIYYGKYVFSSDSGTVDRVRRAVECAGNVKCTDDVVPPTLTVTSGGLILELSKNRAVFSRDVKYEKRAGEGPMQQLTVGSLHLLLESGNIEIPAK